MSLTSSTFDSSLPSGLSSKQPKVVEIPNQSIKQTLSGMFDFQSTTVETIVQSAASTANNMIAFLIHNSQDSTLSRICLYELVPSRVGWQQVFRAQLSLREYFEQVQRELRLCNPGFM